MPRVLLLAARLPFPLLHGSRTELINFDVRGEIVPHEAGTVTLHAVANPFATSAMARPDGSFRFKTIEVGAYTVSVFLGQRGETRMTIEVGPGTADKKDASSSRSYT